MEFVYMSGSHRFRLFDPRAGLESTTISRGFHRYGYSVVKFAIRTGGNGFGSMKGSHEFKYGVYTLKQLQ